MKLGIFGDTRIIALKNYRRQLVAMKNDISTLSTRLGREWTIDGASNGVANYVNDISAAITTAINTLDRDISTAKALLNKKNQQS